MPSSTRNRPTGLVKTKPRCSGSTADAAARLPQIAGRERLDADILLVGEVREGVGQVVRRRQRRAAWRAGARRRVTSAGIEALAVAQAELDDATAASGFCAPTGGGERARPARSAEDGQHVAATGARDGEDVPARPAQSLLLYWSETRSEVALAFSMISAFVRRSKRRSQASVALWPAQAHCGIPDRWVSSGRHRFVRISFRNLAVPRRHLRPHAALPSSSRPARGPG